MDILSGRISSDLRQSRPILHALVGGAPSRVQVNLTPPVGRWGYTMRVIVHVADADVSGVPFRRYAAALRNLIGERSTPMTF